MYTVRPVPAGLRPGGGDRLFDNETIVVSLSGVAANITPISTCRKMFIFETDLYEIFMVRGVNCSGSNDLNLIEIDLR